MPKSPDAFRTISEVADWLGVQAHVLRFWESKFSQVKPIKRAGGRRYYRPTDMLLIGGLKKLLHEDGLTIKGAQKLLREKGVRFVADMSQPLDDLTAAEIEGTATEVTEVLASESVLEADIAEVGTPHAAGTPGVIDQPPEDTSDPAPPPEAEPEETGVAFGEPEHDVIDVDALGEPEVPTHSDAVDLGWAIDAPVEDGAFDAPGPEIEAEPQDGLPPEHDVEPVAEADTSMPQFRARRREHVAADPPADTAPENAQSDATAPVSPEEATPAADDARAGSETGTKPRIVDLPPVPAPQDINVSPSALSALGDLNSLTAQEAREIKPLLARLTRLHASMASPRKDISKD